MAKRKIRKDRVAIFIVAVAAVIAAIYFLLLFIVQGVLALFSKDEVGEDGEDASIVKQELVVSDKAMAERIDKIVHNQYFIDTANIAISVYNVDTKCMVYQRNSNQSLAPASCMKIPTAITAIKSFGLDHRYNEYLLVRGEMHRDTLVGTLLLQADDDPLFTDFTPLISQMKRRGIRHVRGNVILSLARVDTLRPHPSAKIWDISYYKTPILLKGEKKVRAHFLTALHSMGVKTVSDKTVNSVLAKGKFGDGKYHYVAHTSSSMRDVLKPILTNSSNIFAEALFYHIDWKKGLLPERRMKWDRPHTTEAFVRQYIADDIHGDSLVFRDGSGLSPENRLTTDVLVALLRKAYDDPVLRDFFINEALATPANGPRTGSLVHRLAHPEYRGKMFCKTGTLVTIGTSSLSGYLHGGDGHLYIFSIINSNTSVYTGRHFQDDICKAMMRDYSKKPVAPVATSLKTSAALAKSKISKTSVASKSKSSNVSSAPKKSSKKSSSVKASKSSASSTSKRSELSSTQKSASKKKISKQQ